MSGKEDIPSAALDHLPLSQASLMDKLGAAARLVQGLILTVTSQADPADVFLQDMLCVIHNLLKGFLFSVMKGNKKVVLSSTLSSP